ncbi:MAG: hypothetical protein D6824_05715, partial [Planctomycetota bacterium]
LQLMLLALAALALCSGALADTLKLKDGRVLEGEVVREGEGYIYFRYTVAGITQTSVFLTSQILELVRDDDTTRPAKETPAPAAQTRRAPEAPAKPSPRAVDSAAALRIAFITLGDPPHDVVGPYLNAKALKKSVELLEDDQPDVVVLRINSGGGAITEIPKLVNVIQRDLKPKYRVVGWIESAISAAALTAINLEELYFMKKGNLGGAVAFRTTGNGKTQSMQGPQLERFLKQAEGWARNGGHDPLLLRAMQVPTDLSCDIDQNGVVHWRNDLQGQYVVSTKEGDHILTLNSLEAVKYGLANGVADTKDELAKLLGAVDGEWVEVGQDADAYQKQFREAVAEASVAAGKLFAQLDMALQAGELAKARRYLGQLKGWARRAPSLEEYGALGKTPPLNREFFKQVEEQIEKLRKQRRRRGR